VALRRVGMVRGASDARERQTAAPCDATVWEPLFLTR